uniref:Integrase, catalytic region, zinc finger, CCHC-type, peptidase aspartic, catalytic n=1 Tax=Tanacetum cinerariifolium TaxID=118510 RepID=A0A6L2MN76_TANCI|nr:integrase, catalytic region, zinc finger, CCHC-type, peptidase aspartic, catalytic [Tanacetum cinerariifolium]
MSTLNRQTLVESGAFDRPPILEKGSYMPWESRFRMFLDNKKEEGERMWHSIEIRPYVRQRITDREKLNKTILEPVSKITEANKKQYFADIKERIKRLIHGPEIPEQERHSRLMNELDKFVAMKGEPLVYVQNNTLDEYMILSGADNRPPMLDKYLYDSWKGRMELYMQNREHERMILELVENGQLIWPTIEENGVTGIKKYAELSAAEKIQADCDMKATNIILQVKMERFQVNTKFLNSLPPEWSKFVTDVKLVKDLHTTNFDKLHAYLEQHELHPNEGHSATSLRETRSKLFQTSYKSNATSSGGNNDKAMLAEAQEAGQILDEEQLTQDLDTYDFYCDDVSNAKAVLMANISNYGFDVISVVPHSETYLSDMENQKALKELPKVSLVNESLKKLKLHLANFDKVGEYVNMERKRNESCDKCSNVDAKLLKSQNAHSDLLKSYSQLEKHCISLELLIPLNQEIFQKDESWNNQNALEIPEFFKNNDLKAQIQDKDTTICKLKEIIKLMREKSKEENVSYDDCEMETKNVELKNSVAKLLSENERLCKDINHVKHVFKEQYDSIKKTQLLVYVRDTCPNANNLSAKKVDATPKNNVKKVRLSKLYSGCSKHLTGNRSQLMNFVSKFLGTVRFRNDHIARIIGDNDDLGKLDAKANVGIFVGYAPAKKAFKMSGLGLQSMTLATSSSGLIPNLICRQPCIPPLRDDWDHLFQPIFFKYFTPSIVVSPIQEAVVTPSKWVAAEYDVPGALLHNTIAQVMRE